MDGLGENRRSTDDIAMTATFRFAPSPNGYLHLGHAYSAIRNFEIARQTGGRFLLRIEDIDAERCRPEYEVAIFEDLHWMGLEWEEPVRRQSQHLSDYRDALSRLDGAGLIYPGFESRAEIVRLVAARERDRPWPRDPDGAPLYPGIGKTLAKSEREARIASGLAYSLRLDMAAALRAAARALDEPLSWDEIDPGADGHRRRYLPNCCPPGGVGGCRSRP